GYKNSEHDPAGVGVGDSGGSISHNRIVNNNAPGAGAGNGVEFFAPGSQGWSVDHNYFGGNDNADVLLAGGGTVANVSVTSNQFTNSTGNPFPAFQASQLTFPRHHLPA